MGDSMQQPFASFNFKVEISSDGNNEVLALFQEVTGLSASIEVTDLKEGGVNSTVHKLIGHASYGNVTLKRGLIDNAFTQWINDALNGTIYRKDIIITINDDSGEHISYKLLRTLPVKWEGPNLNVMNDSIATESLELAVEGMIILKQ